MDADLKTCPLARLLPPIANLINPYAAHFQTPRNRGRPLATIQRPQYALTQILRIRLHPAPLHRQDNYRINCKYLHWKCSSPDVPSSLPHFTSTPAPGYTTPLTSASITGNSGVAVSHSILPSRNSTVSSA